jgi:heat shock protein HslJ
VRPGRWIALVAAALLIPVVAACGGSEGSAAGVPGVSAVGDGSPRPTGGDELSGTGWSLTSAELLSSASPAPGIQGRGITLEFTSNQARGESGVNSYSATYAAHDDGRLKLGPIISTMKAGDPGAMRVEAEYLGTLGKVTGYSAAHGQLDLFIGRDLVLTYTEK